MPSNKRSYDQAAPRRHRSLVRRAGASKRPIPITDRGQEVAVIANRALLRPVSRKRAILPEYETMMAESPGNDLQAALDEIRGDR